MSVAISQPVYASQGVSSIKFERISSKHGLSQNTIITINQDALGFMWFGTSDGLNRYDGYDFKTYKRIPGDSTSINHHVVNCIYQDSVGILWISTDNGVNRFDPVSGQFSRVAFRNASTELNVSLVTYEIFEISKGVFWIVTLGELIEYNSITGMSKKISLFDIDDPQDNNILITKFKRDSQNNIWLTTLGQGVYKFDPYGNVIKNYRFKKGNNSIVEDNILYLEIDSFGNLWFSSTKGLSKFDTKTETFSTIQLDPNGLLKDKDIFLHKITQDNNGNIWATSNHGIFVVEVWTNTVHHFVHDQSDQNSLSHNHVTSIYKDNQGLIWVGTQDGLNKYDPTKFKFNHIKHDPSNVNSLSANHVNAIHEDSQGRLWVGTWGGGVTMLDKSKTKFAHFKNDPLDSKSLSGDVVRSIKEAPDGVIWIGAENGLNKYNPKTKNFSRITSEDLGLNSYVFEAPFDIQFIDGYAWVGTWQQGLVKVDIQKKKGFQYIPKFDDLSSISNGVVWKIHKDRKGRVWVGTKEGLNIFNPATGTFKRFLHSATDLKSLSNDDVASICETKRGDLWFASFGGGINFYNEETHSFENYTEKDGLANNIIFGLMEDANGFLWMSHNKGISKFEPQTQQFINFTEEDGLQGGNFSLGAFFKSKSGEMFFGGPNGLNYFHPDSLLRNQFEPPVFITGLKLYNEPVSVGAHSILTKTIEHTDEIELKHSQKAITFTFSSLGYSVQQKNTFAYRLEGFERNWNYVDSKHRSANYTNLPPGTYTFKVRTANSDGYWSSNETALLVRITPPPWKSWWAYCLYLLLVSGIIRSFYMQQKRKLLYREAKLQNERKVNDQLKQLDKLKDEFLANTSHELRTPINGIIGIAESLYDGIAGEMNPKAQMNLDLIITSGKRLSTLINDIQDFSKLKHKNIVLNVVPVGMRALTGVVCTISRPLLRGKNVLLKNNLPDDVPLVDGDDNRIHQILQNLIGNAIKFTEVGQIEISAQTIGSLLEIKVSDTGQGISEDKLPYIFDSFEQVDDDIRQAVSGTGLGLAISKQLVELHGGKLRVESIVNKGSDFYFTLPISKTKKKEKGSGILTSEKMEGVVVSYNKPDVNEIPFIDFPEDTIHNIGFTPGGVHILVVDDEPINLHVLENQLTLVGYSIVKAPDGIEALSILKNTNYKFDLILLDVMMPRMSGFEVCKEIRKTHSQTDLPIIFLSAKNMEKDLVAGIKAGANDYISKPFSKNELLARVNTQLERALEKKESDEQLHVLNDAYKRFVPDEFLSFLNKDSVTEIGLGNQVEKEMTVMFSDIRHFTELSENMTPQENFNFLNSYLSVMEPLFKEYHGFIDKYIGDSIMGLFPTNADDALSVGISMLEKLLSYNEGRRRAGYEPIKIGMGMNTGRLILGTIGGTDRMDGTVISDSVNLASRLEGMSKMYGLDFLITEFTHAKLKDPSVYKMRIIDRVAVQGKQKAVTVYEIFEGDVESVKRLKDLSKKTFEMAIRLYQLQGFEEALGLFTECFEKNPDDTAAAIYIERCRRHIKEGPMPDWDGVTRLEYK